jgi:transcriptional regulator with XRE-family HTH domain
MDSQAAPAPISLGTCIRQARERAGLSLRNLEAITGISRPMLNRLEHDQLENPSPTVLQQVAEALELDSHDLFAFVGYRPSENLPGLAPYLRAKYQLPPDALAEASKALRDILAKYDGLQEPEKSVPWHAASHVSDERS